MTNNTPQAGKTAEQWSYSINFGPEGEQDWAMVYDDKGRHVGNFRLHHAIAVVEAMNQAREGAGERTAERPEKVEDAIKLALMGIENHDAMGRRFCLESNQGKPVNYLPYIAEIAATGVTGVLLAYIAQLERQSQPAAQGQQAVPNESRDVFRVRTAYVNQPGKYSWGRGDISPLLERIAQLTNALSAQPEPAPKTEQS